MSAGSDEGQPAVRRAIRIGLAIVVALLITFVNYKIFRVNSTTAGFTYLVAILALAARAGLPESIAASLVSVAAYNFYFFAPVGTFTIADPQNWVALCAFLLTAIIGSHLSSEAQRRAAVARAGQAELERMFDFSRGLMLAQEDESFAQHVARQLVSSFQLENAWFLEGMGSRAVNVGGGAEARALPMLTKVAESGRSWHDGEGRMTVLPVRLGGSNLGSVAVTGATLPSTVAMEATAHLIAIAVERSRAQQRAAHLQAERESEQLKSTLLDALAHEFKTPLTSIKAATTSFLSTSLPVADQQELVTIIDEEADRMTRLVNDSIELARWGAETVALQKDFYAASDLISSVLVDLRASLDGRRVRVEVSPALPSVFVDRKASELALRQVVTNAVKYSPPESEIHIAGQLQDGSVAIAVSNEGMGIKKADQERIFEKFYRGEEVRNRIAGTGLGLTIARQIVDAQGGTIYLQVEEYKRVTFTLTLPTDPLDRLLADGLSSADV